MTLKELQPSLDYDDNQAKSCLYLKDGVFTVHVNEAALAALRWSLWWLAADAPRGEDVSISSFWRGDLVDQGTQIGYCEITLVGEGKSRNPKAPHKLRLEDDRLDLFVTREPAKEAFFAVQEVGFGKADPDRTQIFGLLWITLLPDPLWPAGVA